MITYALSCDNAHQFDVWFKSAAAYEEQRAQEIISCPVCGSNRVQKALMAPALARPAPDRVSMAAGHPQQAQLMEMMRALRRKVMDEADYVGDRFAEEARRIHFKEVDPHGIYGEATREEVTGLIEEGIAILPLPSLPEEAN